jgi:hypothetical protein
MIHKAVLDDNVPWMRTLLEAKADPNDTVEYDEPPLFSCKSAAAVDALLAAGAELEYQVLWRALHLARAALGRALQLSCSSLWRALQLSCSSAYHLMMRCNATSRWATNMMRQCLEQRSTMRSGTGTRPWRPD